CRTIRRPGVFSGLGMLTIFTLDLDRGLYTADTQAVMADAQIVYGSTTSLYVATQRWTDPRLALGRVPAGQATLISRFDVSDPARTTLVATGTVPGYLLNQFSLSEYNGYLRVATTSRPIWWGGGGPPSVPSTSAVTVLAQRGGLLTQVGQVGGLGAGQQIYSVRFVDDAGYVVTFRQVDPLYTIDLRSPTAPRVAGQLELAGYSAYLHPLAPGLLLGIGQAVGPGNEPAGTQLELFDVSDPSAPRLIQRTLVGSGSSSEVQSDHHAFLYWPPTGLAVLPVQIYTPTLVSTTGVIPPSAPAIAPSPAAFVGAIGYHVDRSGITEIGRIAHPALAAGYVPSISRSVVVGPRLFTVSDGGVLGSSLDSLTPGAFAAFPAATVVPPPVPLVAY
ncbi:MAG TPA: beta-propeller domain-containing protein, partial [Solirubrobacteraceae bacterium]|nr:beta-propeller domain-containing protein [Solirubrobacteraceae bacterium]